MISPERTYQRINTVRHNKGYAPLQWDNTLAEIALQRAVATYERRDDTLPTQAYGFSSLTEDTAERYRNADNLVKAWEKSPDTHLFSTHTDIGIATYGNVTTALYGTRI